jgi:3',5'-cyclic AMP phosphodiesterase CpdA
VKEPGSTRPAQVPAVLWRALATLVVVAALGDSRFLAQDLLLPNRPGSLKFAAIGDNGTGEPPEYDVASQMDVWHGRFPYDMVIMLGDNMYGSQQPADFVQKFQTPYKPLLDAGVKFYATLGNHDKTSNDAYQPFGMGGQRYYTFARGNVRFLVLDSNYLDPAQVTWLESALKDATEPWKICYFHHPLYSDGGRHGPAVDLRVRLEPIFVKYGVNVVYSGHDHIYERLTPQKGIYYFVSGAGGELRKGDLHRTANTAAGFDEDRSFMLNEVVGDDLSFQVISRTGRTVDQGVIHRSPTS